jgi:hypothetical protein
VIDCSDEHFDPHVLLKISDFGLAHVIKQGQEKAFIKHRCGTFNYTAPEVHDVYMYLFRILI